MKKGRPTRYRPEYADQARQAYELGAIDEDIARLFDVDISTFYRWRHAHADFAAACVTGREHADDRVEASLYQRACGYDYTAERAFMFSTWTDPLIVRFSRRVLADPRAAMQWLRVRRPEAWRIKEDDAKEVLAEVLEEAFARVAEHRGGGDYER
jgi:hypothetical protein